MRVSVSEEIVLLVIRYNFANTIRKVLPGLADPSLHKSRTECSVVDVMARADNNPPVSERAAREKLISALYCQRLAAALFRTFGPTYSLQVYLAAENV